LSGPLEHVGLNRVRIEWPNGEFHNHVYTTAQEAPADDMGPQGIDLISFTGAFPPKVVHGWAEQNVAPADGDWSA
jgi:hypothetical protein